MRYWIRTKIYKIEESFLITVIKHGMSMMIPFILVGGLSNALLYFPIQSYQQFICESNFKWISYLLSIMVQGTFGIFSIATVVALSLSYAMEKNEPYELNGMYVMVALGAFCTQLNIGTERFNINELGVSSCFSAIVVTLLACFLFHKLRKIKAFTLEEYTIGMEGIAANAIQSMVPALVIIFFFAVCNKVLVELTGAANINQLLSYLLCQLFEDIQDESGFFSGILYTLLLHMLWYLGFHGSNILEPVALSKFQFTGNGQIFSKDFFDVFVVMGGCGTTICVLLCLLIFYRSHRMGNLAKVASFTVVFNINEVLNFGIPIILNPVFVIPFLVTPIVSFVVSYGAVYFGLVPTMVNKIAWTTPVLLSGYVATGSIRGSILQVVCISLGMLIYAPFIRAHIKLEERHAKTQLREVISQLQACEERRENPRFLTRTDKVGLMCKVLLKDLKNAIENEEIYLLYQPKVDNEGKCIGAEALLRWEHPLYGFIYPPLTVYLAKEGDILPKLEEKIFEMAVKAINQTAKQYNGEFKISVNITAKSLLWDLDDCIQEFEEKYEVSPKRLWIEITEQDMISKADVIINKINKLKSMGHTLLIDDFGMGYTSLLYLQSNFFNIVKLDGSLIKDILTNTTNQKIVASIVELGEKLNVKVIAEYVETKEQCQLLEELGCNLYQGYFFSKPIPLEDFIKELKRRNEPFAVSNTQN